MRVENTTEHDIHLHPLNGGSKQRFDLVRADVVNGKKVNGSAEIPDGIWRDLKEKDPSTKAQVENGDLIERPAKAEPAKAEQKPQQKPQAGGGGDQT